VIGARYNWFRMIESIAGFKDIELSGNKRQHIV
jgi:hypothetical protein